MKLVSSIRSGLSRIPGALQGFPPNEGYEGIQEAVVSGHTQTIWPGESGEPDAATSVPNDSQMEDEGNDDGFDLDGIGHGFDPLLEIGAEIDDSFPGLDGEEGKKIQQSVKLHGMDALALYVSFHHPSLQWGIYVPVTGLAYLIRHAFGDLPASLTTKAHLAFHALLNHELFHFATDYAIAQAELDHQEPWYVPAKMGFRFDYPGYCVEEEQLANAYMLSAFRSMKPALRVKGKQAALQAFVKKQPPGYCDALNVRPQHLGGLLENLAHRYGSYTTRGASHALLWNPDFGYDWAGKFPIRPRIDWRYCPIHLFDDSDRIGMPPGWLSLFSRLAAIHETDEFIKKIKTMAPPIQRAWERTKQKLAITITAGADFKKWPKGGDNLFSVRVNDNFRAHLLRQRESDGWLAIAIGNHKEMGHG
jgi:hypothetical protein